MVNSLKNIPSVDELLSDHRVQDHLQKYQRTFVVQLLREAIDAARTRLRLSDSEVDRSQISAWICQDLQQRIETLTQGTLKRVINGTGVVLHTNLGRAPLSKTALNYLHEMGTFYNNLELDLEKGERGSRYVHVEELLCRLTKAEAALVVNNNAAAVLLGLNTLAQGKEVIVSRGQLVEIGGAFRIPEVMKLSGALLKEVGTTNKTYLRDYAEAIGEDTGLLFAAHTSISRARRTPATTTPAPQPAQRRCPPVRRGCFSTSLLRLYTLLMEFLPCPLAHMGIYWSYLTGGLNFLQPFVHPFNILYLYITTAQTVNDINQIRAFFQII
jgi:hypothetical protein